MKSPARSMRRFWGLVHVRPLAVIIGVTEFIFIIVQALFAVSYLSSSSHTTAAVIHMILVILTAIVVFLLIAGIFYRVPLLLGPHIVMQVSITIILSLLTTGFVIYLFAGASVQIRITLAHASFPITVEPELTENHVIFPIVSKLLTVALATIAILYIFVCLISMWSIGVVWDCYQFLSTYDAKKATIFGIVISEEGTRENMRQYGVEGGGEEDTAEYSIVELRKPVIPS